jgi:hypothetical protein
LDVADGNPGHLAHARLNNEYNNFDEYKPENEFNDEAGELGALDPNDKTIRIRSPGSTKAVWSSLKSAFFLCHNNWQKSGHMDPESFPIWSKDRWHLLYLWKNSTKTRK